MKNLTFFSLFFLFISCTTQISLVVQDDLSTSVQFSSQGNANFDELIKKMRGSTESVFDIEEVKSNLSDGKRKNIQIKTVPISSIDIVFSTDTIPEIFSQIDDLFLFTKTTTESNLRITITPANIQKIIEFLPEESQECIDLLMAPVFTGEKLSQTEYLDLISLIYGNAVGTDLTNTQIQFALTAPSVVKKVNISSLALGSAKKNKKVAQITLSLLEILCLQKNDFIEITW